jgi:predicted MFS family arabinose efflux permease
MINNTTRRDATRRELWLLLTLAGIQFTHILDFMIMMPLGPQFTQLFGITDAQFGLLVSAYTLAAGTSGLLASAYIDRFGRKRLLLTLYSLFALATLACALAPTYGSLMAARIAAGAFGGVLSALSQTIVGDVIPFERRGRAMGIVMTAFAAASVAGVPAGLLLAERLGWHAPFFAIAALSAAFAMFAAFTLPALTDHLKNAQPSSAFERIRSVLADRNHLKAFAFSALLMFAGFTTVPYLAMNLQFTVGLRADQLPYVYLFGGVATLVTARVWGSLSDSWGKVATLRMLAACSIPVMLTVTLLPPGTALWIIFVSTTMLMIFMSGRMIPGMAIVTSAANPQLRGTFMSLNSAVQSAGMGVAAFVGGSLISRNAGGQLQNYWMTAVVGAVSNLLAIWLVGRLDLRNTAQKPAIAATNAEALAAKQ